MPKRYQLREADGFRTLIYDGEWGPDLREAMFATGADGLSGRTWQPRGLEFLSEFPQLRSAAFVAERAGDLAPLGNLSGLEALMVGIVRPSRRAVDFPSFPSLRTLITEGSPSLTSLLRNPTIEHLRIERAPGPDLSFTSHLPRLRQLFVGSSPRITSLQGIDRLTELRTAEFAYLTALPTLGGLSELPELRQVDLETCKRIGRLDELSGIGRLEVLGVKNCGEVASLGPLRSLTHLQRFYAWESTRVLDGDLSPLLELPRLTTVAMQSRREYRPSVEDVQAQLAARQTCAESDDAN